MHAQSQNWCSKHVCSVRACTPPRISVMNERLSHLLLAVVFRWTSYLATAVRSAPVVHVLVSLRNATLATVIQGSFSWVASEDEVDHYTCIEQHRTLTRLDPGSARG